MGPVFLSQAKWISLNLLIIEISLGFFFSKETKWVSLNESSSNHMLNYVSITLVNNVTMR